MKTSHSNRGRFKLSFEVWEQCPELVRLIQEKVLLVWVENFFDDMTVHYMGFSAELFEPVESHTTAPWYILGWISGAKGEPGKLVARRYEKGQDETDTSFPWPEIPPELRPVPTFNETFEIIEGEETKTANGGTQ